MYDININHDIFIIKPIYRKNIKKLYTIYTNTKEFKYATGNLNNPLDFNQFTNDIYDFLRKENTFILEISLADSGDSIGVIKGSIVDHEKILWINEFVIYTSFQAMGYGNKVIVILEEYFKIVYDIKRVYLSVYKSNLNGINFWNKCCYKKIDYMNQKDIKNEQVQIMWKML